MVVWTLYMICTHHTMWRTMWSVCVLVAGIKTSSHFIRACTFIDKFNLRLRDQLRMVWRRWPHECHISEDVWRLRNHERIRSIGSGRNCAICIMMPVVGVWRKLRIEFINLYIKLFIMWLCGSDQCTCRIHAVHPQNGYGFSDVHWVANIDRNSGYTVICGLCGVD